MARKFLCTITIQNGLVQDLDLDTISSSDLPATAVTPGSYTNASITVDAYGRLTAASNGSPVTSVTSSGGSITVTGTTTANVEVAIGHENTWTAAQGVSVSSSSAWFVGPNGDTNPALRIVTNIPSAATGLSVTGNAAGSGVTLTALSSASTDDIRLQPKGVGSTVYVLNSSGSPVMAMSGAGGNTPTAKGDVRIGIGGTGANGSGLTLVEFTTGNLRNMTFGVDNNWGYIGAITSGLTLAFDNASKIKVRSDGSYGFGATTTITTTSYDTAIARNAAGILEVNTGTAGTFAALRCGQPATDTIGHIVKGIASRTATLLQLQNSASASLGSVGGTIFNDFTDTSTTSTDGTEDNLYSYTTAANTFAINGDSVEQIEHIQFVSSATAARRVKRYFAGTLIFDSGSLTLSLGGDFTIWTTVERESSTVVRCTVSVTTTSASTVPYSTYTRITGLTLTSTNILKTTGIASGAGAASGDILNKMSKVWAWPAA